jgi:hypothetical protein
LAVAPFLGDPFPSVPPDKEQWPGILKDLRAKQQREILKGHPWLRTCYTEGSDELHNALLRDYNPREAFNGKLILDDALLYSYGNDWFKIFSVLPELLLGKQHYWQLDHWNKNTDLVKRHVWDQLYMLDYQKGCVATQPSTTDELEAAFYDDFGGENQFADALRRLHVASTRGWLIVADKVAMQSGLVLLVFYDDTGRVVRQDRVVPSECSVIRKEYLSDNPTLRGGQPGPDYDVGGSRGPPFEDLKTTLTLPRPPPGSRANPHKPSPPDLGPAYRADRERVLKRQKAST